MASSAPDHLRTPGLISNRPCYEGIKLTAGNLVRAELHIDLAPGLGSGDFSFETVFEAVIITADTPIDPPAGMVSWWSADGHTLDIVDGNDGTLSGDASFARGMVG